jgi:hypothetical protein
VSERVHVGPEAIGTPLRGPAAITSFLRAKAKMRPSATGLSSASSPSLLATPPLHDPPRTGEEAPKILENDVDHVLASWRHIAIAFWRRETRPDAIERLGLALRALQDATGHAPGLFMVIGESAPLPSAEARALSATVLRRFAARVFRRDLRGRRLPSRGGPRGRCGYFAACEGSVSIQIIRQHRRCVDVGRDAHTGGRRSLGAGERLSWLLYTAPRGPAQANRSGRTVGPAPRRISRRAQCEPSPCI